MKRNRNKIKFLKIRAASVLCALLAVCITFCSCAYFEFDLSDFLNEEEELTPQGGSLVCHFLDVGQGDSIFIELPNAQSMLIDAGVSGEGEGIVSYIDNLGYSQIDYLIATHPHADHIGSMTYVVENTDIGQVYMPNVGTTTKTYENLLTAVSDKGLKITSATAGMNIFEEDGCSVDILGPVTINESDLNNCSIVLKITYGSTKFLFTGDAEEEELSEITYNMSADVLKVGHHGSNTSTTEDFLYNVNPGIAVISVGEGNDYGHPHESTLELLEQFNAEIYRTDLDKTVTVTSDGSEISVETNGDSIERNN